MNYALESCNNTARVAELNTYREDATRSSMQLFYKNFEGWQTASLLQKAFPPPYFNCDKVFKMRSSTHACDYIGLNGKLFIICLNRFYSNSVTGLSTE